MGCCSSIGCRRKKPETGQAAALLAPPPEGFPAKMADGTWVSSTDSHREWLAAQQQSPPQQQQRAAGAGAGPLPFGTPARVVVYDWDCTITSRHMFKVLSDWSGYAEDFERWCTAQNIPSPLREPLDPSRGIVSRMEFGGGDAGRALLRRVIREYFLGGEERVAELTAHFQRLQAAEGGGCKLCVLTRGETASLRLAFEVGVPEWSPYFVGGWIANARQQYFTITSSNSSSGSLSPLAENLCGSGLPARSRWTKEQIIASLYPLPGYAQQPDQTRELLLLVDDSITTGSRLQPGTDDAGAGGAQQEEHGVRQLDLPYEREGLDAESMRLVEAIVMSTVSDASGPAAAAAAATPGTAAGGSSDDGTEGGPRGVEEREDEVRGASVLVVP
jgi:hypothetical protein